MAERNTLILRGFEVVGITIYAAALIAALRRRHPVYLGLFFACNTMIVWDWIFNANLSVGSYLALRRARRWGQIPDEIPFDPRHGDFWKGFWMAGAAIWSAFWLSFTLQMVWYVLARPWSQGPRAF